MDEKYIGTEDNNLGLVLFSSLPSPDCYLGRQMLQHIASWEETNACYPSSRMLNRRHPMAMSNPTKTPLSVCLITLLNNGPMQKPKAHISYIILLSEGSAQYQCHNNVGSFPVIQKYNWIWRAGIAQWKGNFFNVRIMLLISKQEEAQSKIN